VLGVSVIPIERSESRNLDGVIPSERSESRNLKASRLRALYLDAL
jgi:hypothetical protein